MPFYEIEELRHLNPIVFIAGKHVGERVEHDQASSVFGREEFDLLGEPGWPQLQAGFPLGEERHFSDR